MIAEEQLTVKRKHYHDHHCTMCQYTYTIQRMICSSDDAEMGRRWMRFYIDNFLHVQPMFALESAYFLVLPKLFVFFNGSYINCEPL